jgi:hypothetical protein
MAMPNAIPFCTAEHRNGEHTSGSSDNARNRRDRVELWAMAMAYGMDQRSDGVEQLRIENIEETRQSVGIDDIELRATIRALKVGDLVKLTFLTGATAFETLSVRITSIRGSNYSGELAQRPTSTALSRLPAGGAIAFTAAHIHSVLNLKQVHEA